jgi:hypothetical protein
MHLKFHPTLNATEGKSMGFGKKPCAYGNVTGVIQEESPIFQRLLTEQYARKRAMNRPPPKLSMKEEMNLGSNYNGTPATLKALYSSGYINKPSYSDNCCKVELTDGLKKAMKVKEVSHRFYGPSILF